MNFKICRQILRNRQYSAKILAELKGRLKEIRNAKIYLTRNIRKLDAHNQVNWQKQTMIGDTKTR